MVLPIFMRWFSSRKNTDAPISDSSILNTQQILDHSTKTSTLHAPPPMRRPKSKKTEFSVSGEHSKSMVDPQERINRQSTTYTHKLSTTAVKKRLSESLKS
ncbi:hypothetical protein V6N13_074053 [Hibiscus sabdariffa]|uniref:Uncharacterized protein n=1 Tax=Hibiscus sabdariffa TaxID=183260 RepID=A0ABR2U7F3_9ROSI